MVTNQYSLPFAQTVLCAHDCTDYEKIELKVLVQRESLKEKSIVLLLDFGH